MTIIINEKQAEKNLKEFFDKYGIEGFLRLYFTNYLFELTMHFLRSKDSREHYDSSFRYHFDETGLVSSKKEEEFRQNVRKECAKKAASIVEELKHRKLVDKFTLDIVDKRTVKILQKTLGDLLKELSEVSER